MSRTPQRHRPRSTAHARPAAAQRAAAGSQRPRVPPCHGLTPPAEPLLVLGAPLSTGHDLLITTATGTLLASAVIHAAVIREHLQEWQAAGLFFLLLGVAQVIAALLVVGKRRTRSVLLGVGVLSFVPVLVWAVSRTVGLPFGPDPGSVEPLGLADAASTMLEIGTILAVVGMLSGGGQWQRLRRQPVPRGAVALAAVAPVLLAMMALLLPSGGHSRQDAHDAGPAAAALPQDGHAEESAAAVLGPVSAPGATATAGGDMAGMPGMSGTHQMPAEGGTEPDMHAGTDTLGLGDSPVAVANLGVTDQVSNGRSMTVGDAEVSGSPGWVVVRQDRNGAPGAIIGRTRRLNGQHGDPVTVHFVKPVTSGSYWVSLHRDLGRQRVLEYPGADVVATGAGSPLVRPVTLTVR